MISWKILAATLSFTIPFLPISSTSCGQSLSASSRSSIQVRSPLISVFFSVSNSCPGLTLRGFWMRRLQFAQLVSSNSSMNMSRYIRLMSLSIIDMMCTVPLGVYSIYIGNKGVSLAPWVSWEDTHFNFSRVGVVPSLIWRSDPSFQTSVELTRWLPVVCAFLFFALFGFASEAKKHYKMVFTLVAKPLGFGQPPKVPPKTVLPGYVSPVLP